MLTRRIEAGKKSRLWASGEEVFDWWLSEKSEIPDLDGQMSLLEDYE
jgi:hypothetical protein